ncbi:hypothetical protein Cco03nite_27570 [Catellatospora coxensis]|uniref:Uncharacterized protein n=1 Tax=Catellatospora coxensis TaxID=310354 RepID=A0A8J3KN69_9ACTN|nr:hypothetical protein Cco03nite_27570 [Catellatospora coxensis]
MFTRSRTGSQDLLRNDTIEHGNRKTLTTQDFAAPAQNTGTAKSGGTGQLGTRSNFSHPPMAVRLATSAAAPAFSAAT